MKQINYSELVAQANTMASEALRNHKRSCFSTHVRFENGKRIEERRQHKPITLTWRKALSNAFKVLYNTREVVRTLDVKEVLRRECERLENERIYQQFREVVDFNSSLRFCSLD